MPKEVVVQVARLEGSPLAERGKFAQAHEHTPIEKDILERRGRLFVVLDINADTAFDTALAGKLVWDSLVDEYFTDADETPFKALEQAVLAAKNRLVNLTHPLEGDKPFSELTPRIKAELDLAAVVVWQSLPKAGGSNVLYLARHGEPAIFLKRAGLVRKLLGGEEPSSIASLLIEDKDELIFGSRDFGKSFTAGTLPETPFLKKQFGSGRQVAGMAATILELSMVKATPPKPVPLTVKEEGPSAPSVVSQRQALDAEASSGPSDQDKERESRTQPFKARKKIRLPVRGIGAKAAKCLEKLPLLALGKTESASRHDEEERSRVPAGTRRSVTLAPGVDDSAVFKPAPRIYQVGQAAVSSFALGVKDAVRKPIGWINKGIKARALHGEEIYLDRRRRQISLPKVISALVLILLLSVTFTLWRQRRQARTQEFVKVLSSIEDTLDEAEDLVGLSDDRAKELWGEATAALEKAATLSPKSEVLAALSKKADKLLNRIERIVPVAEKHLLYDLSSQGEVEALAITGAAGKVYVADGKSGATLAITQSSTPEVGEATANEVKGAKKLTAGGDLLYLLTDKAFYRYNLKTGRTDSPLTFKNYGAVAAVDHYLSSNLYFLFPGDNQIYVYYGLGSGYSAALNWLKESSNLRKAVDISVDGAIWVLTDGGVLRFMGGKKEPFTLKNLSSPFTKLTAIYTRPNFKMLYIADGDRVLVFDKDGNFKKQYKGDILGDIVDLWATDNEKKLFILTRDKVFRVGL